MTDATANGIVNKAYEIDLDNIGAIKKALNINKLDCYPLLWVCSNPHGKDWIVKFQ